MKAYVLAGVVAVAALAMARGTDDPAEPNQPLKFGASGGRVEVTGKDFWATATRAEVDRTRNTLTLEGRDKDDAATAVFRPGKQPQHNIAAQRITIDLATGNVRCENTKSSSIGEAK